MSTKEMAYNIIDCLSEEQINAFIALFRDLAHIPNEETCAALDDVVNGKNLVGPFNSAAELMEDLNADD